MGATTIQSERAACQQAPEVQGNGVAVVNVQELPAGESERSVATVRVEVQVVHVSTSVNHEGGEGADFTREHLQLASCGGASVERAGDTVVPSVCGQDPSGGQCGALAVPAAYTGARESAWQP